MKNQILLTSIFLLLLSFATPVFAQQKDADAIATQMTDKLKTPLSLTDEQYSKILTLNTNFVKESGSLKSSADSKSQKMMKIKKLDDERVSSIKALLTDEQKKLFDEQRKENMKTFKEKFKAARGS